MTALIDDMKHGWSPAGLRRRGDAVICGRIATTLLSVALRLWIELGCGADRWLQTVEDPRIGQAVDGMHSDLTRTWSVDDLARLATMSRSAFAARFREVVGTTPASYLTAIRMEAARELLRTEDVTVTELAYRVGYSSDAGFSRAFRRHTGVVPSRWRTQRPEPSPSVA
ncbi:AraC family transcriptional regulator [Nakamurella silvestris]|nr:AraC family transcriptional regulator [Nakamurella silvestris]